MILEYDELCDLVKKHLDGNTTLTKLSFSIFDNYEEEPRETGPWWVKPPFETLNDVFTEGKVIFLHAAKPKVKSFEFVSPTWGEVIVVANNFCSGDHIFLEDVKFVEEKNGIKYYEMWFGS